MQEEKKYARSVVMMKPISCTMAIAFSVGWIWTAQIYTN